MGSMVNMLRDSAEAGGRDLYSCSSSAWDLLVELGQAFGWQVRGTTYVPVHKMKVEVTDVRHDYRPGDSKDFKRIESEDALAWAAALTNAKQSPHLTAMIGERPESIMLSAASTADQVQSANAPFAAIMEEFISYAGGGGFLFAAAPKSGSPDSL